MSNDVFCVEIRPVVLKISGGRGRICRRISQQGIGLSLIRCPFLYCKHNHEDSFIGGRISVASPVEGTPDRREPAERQLAASSRTEEAGGGGGGGSGGDSFSLIYGEL